MEDDFDNLRVLTAKSYNRICRYLNVCIYEAKIHRDSVTIEPEDMEKDMEELRMGIGVICASYSDEFKDVSVGLELETFNPEI